MHRNYNTHLQNCKDAYERIEEVFKRCNHKVLHEQPDFNVNSAMYSMRMMALHDWVENGFLKLPEALEKSSLGMHLMIG